MTLKEAIDYDSKPYFSNYPFMAHDSGGTIDGNSILYAATYGLLHKKLFGEYQKAAEQSALIYAQSMVSPGVINRGPFCQIPQTHDDYVGLCTLSFLNHGGAANAIYQHGKANSFVYPNGGDSYRDMFNGWFWRLPGMVQHIKLCAGVSLNLFDWLLMSLGILWNAYLADGTSGIILTWHMVSVYQLGAKKNWLADYAVQTWHRKLIEKYPAAMGDVFGVYFGKSHVLTKWAQGIK